MAGGDSRKEFILATTGNYFGISPKDSELVDNVGSVAVNNFLDDGSTPVLAAKMEGGKKVSFSNQVVIMFLKFVNVEHILLFCQLLISWDNLVIFFI